MPLRSKRSVNGEDVENLYYYNTHDLDNLCRELKLKEIKATDKELSQQWNILRETPYAKNIPENIRKWIEAYRSFIGNVGRVVQNLVTRCKQISTNQDKFRSDELKLTEINVLDKCISQFLNGIENSYKVFCIDGLGNEIQKFIQKSHDVEAQLLMIRQDDIDVETKTFRLYIKELIDNCLIMIVPPPKTIKVENRSQNKKPSISIRLLGNDAFKSCVSLQDISVLQTDQGNGDNKQVLSQYYLIGDWNKKEQIGMKNIEINLDLKNKSQTKDREKSTRESTVSCIRYFIQIHLSPLEWQSEKYRLSKCSRPFIIMTQTSQKVNAVANLEWFKHFGQDSQPQGWMQFQKLLKEYYTQKTDKELNDRQLSYLKSRFMVDDNEGMTLNKLLTKKYSKNQYTPWFWFCSCINLTKQVYARDLWTNNFIYGFISKEFAEELLKDQNNGSFIIRFAESDITVSQRTDPIANFTLAVRAEYETYHLRDFLHNKDLEKQKNLFDVLSKMKIHSKTSKLLENGRVLSYSSTNNFEWRDVSSYLTEDSSYYTQNPYNAEMASFEVRLKKYKNTESKIIPELQDTPPDYMLNGPESPMSPDITESFMNNLNVMDDSLDFVAYGGDLLAQNLSESGPSESKKSCTLNLNSDVNDFSFP